jgi:hypothetical protein
MEPERVMGLILVSFGIAVVVAAIGTARAIAGEVGGAGLAQGIQPVSSYWVGAISMMLGTLMVWFGKRGSST